MKAEKIFGAQSPIKTHGLERNPSVYGALPFTREEIQRGAQEARNEATEHEKEISAPILSYQGRGSEFSSQSGGLGLTDLSIVRGVQQWEAEQRALFANHAAQVSAILPNATNQPPPPIKLGHAL
jgi:hypothetical protein